jgi:GT2 family glycosyltransferase/glycosyltransferase involved in cell wall biosynthesis/SAM-dependent methyltransferase
VSRKPLPTDFVSKASLWTPERITESAWHVHAPFAFWLVDALRPATFVELGTHTGFSYLSLCQAVDRLGVAARGFAVDHWRGDEHSGFYGEEVLDELAAYHDARYSAFSSLVRSTFDDAAHQFDDGTIDLLHVDGLHTYEAVRHDFETWRPKLSDRSVVLFHDTNAREPGFGVYRLWGELRGEYPGFEFVHGHGLGVLGVGTELPRRLAALLDAEADERLTAEIRAVYASLGEAVELRWELDRTRETVELERSEAAAELAGRDAALQPLQAQLAALVEKLEPLEGRLERLREDLAARDAELEAVRADLAAREAEADRVRSESAAHAAEVAARDADVAAAHAAEVAARDADVAALAEREAAERWRADELERQLSALVRSESVRLTAPLRWVGSSIRRLRPTRATTRRVRGLPRRALWAAHSARWRWRSRTRASAAQVPAPSTGRARIVFVSGEPHTPGHSYRIENVAAAFPPLYFETVVVRVEELGNRLDELADVQVLWVWRAPYSKALGAAFESARAAGARIVYDTDDLMFEPELARAEVIDGIRTHRFSEADVGRLFGAVQRALLEADHCTAPTASLARRMRLLGKPTTVVPNGFDGQWLRTAREVSRRPRAERDDSLVRIGYASGSFTHQRDLAVAMPALTRIVKEHPEVRFVCFEGTIDVGEFPALEELSDQLELRPLVPLHDLLGEYARFDVNIAPLEVGNLFCEAKSELKFFEAALAGTVTVASPTEPLAAAVRHGETGLLATDEQSWYESLKLLVRDADARRRMAEAAYRDVLWQFGPERRSLIVNRLVNGFLAAPAVAADLSRAAVSVDPPLPPLPLPPYEVVYESWRSAQSRVTVVVPVFNYADLVEQALDSVREQTVGHLDLVVVDDHSTDDSVAHVRRWLARHGDRFDRVALLRNRVNSGLAQTRNAGVDFGDTELFLPLDPDNLLLPHLVESALAALDDSGAAVAFPTIELFGESAGVIPGADWDPTLLRGANYIDAMALVRRACWLAVGGYSRLDVDGWEDYDLWCKFVERGFFGVRVPEIGARYRVHGSSMLTTTTDLPENKARLLEQITERHGWLDIALTAGRDGQEPRAPTRAMTEEPRSLAATRPRKMPYEGDARARVVAGPASAPSHEPELEGRRWQHVLRCPLTGEELAWSGDELVSKPSGRSWPIVQGRPVFVPAGRSVARHPDEHLSNPLPEEALRLFDDSEGLVLNLSAGGTVTRHPRVVEVEYAIFRHTDVVADAHELPFVDEAFETVVCMNAFEHYSDPSRVADEIWRVLKPGGLLFLRTAFLQPMHEEPNHFYNCTKYGLEQWLRRFEIEDVRVSDNFHPLYALSWLASDLESGYAEVSARTAAAFRRTSVDEFARFWREPDEQGSKIWRDFSALPSRTMEKAAAGWQATARKPP